MHSCAAVPLVFVGLHSRESAVSWQPAEDVGCLLLQACEFPWLCRQCTEVLAKILYFSCSTLYACKLRFKLPETDCLLVAYAGRI